MKAKPIYNVWCTTKFGTGVQPVKALNKKEARTKFKKRFPKSTVLDITKREEPLHSWNKAI